MDFGKAFSFMFDDEDWVKKLALASVLSLTVIGVIPVLGWGLEVIRRVVEGDPEPLPDWSNFGQYIVKGLLAGVTVFVYFLPVIILSSCNAGAGTLMGNMDEDVAVPLIATLTICLSCVYILYSVAASLVIPAALGNYATTGEFGSVFKFGQIFRMVKDNIGNFGLVFLGTLLADIIAPLGTIACVIGVAFTSAYAILFVSHLIGQAYKLAEPSKSVANEPIPDAS